MNLKLISCYITSGLCLITVIYACVINDKATPDLQLINDALIEYKDFPKAGVNFFDVGGILKNPRAFKAVIDNLAEHYKDKKIDVILALDSRGFLFATPLAYKLNIPVVMVRKVGKLPGKTLGTTFNKEYGSDVIEIQEDALLAKQRVIIIDDLVVTGGTLRAAIKLARMTGAEVVELASIVDVTEFKDRRNLDVAVYSVIKK